MVVYTVVGFIVVWGVLGSLLIAGTASFLNFWRSLTPRQQRLKVSQVDLEIRKARRRMIAETLRQAQTENGISNGSGRWSGQ